MAAPTVNAFSKKLVEEMLAQTWAAVRKEKKAEEKKGKRRGIGYKK